MTKEQIVAELLSHFTESQEAPATRLEYYRLVKQLGKGAFGKVLLGVHRLTGMHVAIKAIEKARLDSEYAKRKVFSEVFLLKRIHHRHVVRILEVFESSKHVLLVMEYTSGGDLLQFVKYKKRLSEAEARLIFRQIVEGAIAIHSYGILHRDFKLDNILLDGNYSTIKICDFGVSRILKRGQVCYDKCGTPAYIAPEIIAEQGYEGFSVDTWSIGVMLYAMTTGTVPFRAPSISELHKLVLKGQYSLPEHISPALGDLLGHMMAIVPSSRLSLQNVLQHPWMTYEPLSDEPSLAPLFKAKRFLVEPRVTLDVFLLAKVESLGWPQQVLIDCLTANELNYGTAAYFLLHLALN
jgi:serine/threonine protein kinase